MYKSWWVKFWDEHGTRLLFMGAATLFAVAFWFLPDMKDVGKTIFTGIAMLCFNKARGVEKNK